MDTATVVYPSSIFSLEKHELFPFERFAYSVLSIGVQALGDVRLTTNLRVDFESSSKSPWNLNAGISTVRDGAGTITAFKISTTSMTPPMMFALCHWLAGRLTDDETMQRWRAAPAEFRAFISDFARVFHEVSLEVGRSNISKGTRALFRALEIDHTNSSHGVAAFDILTRLVANHEIAHAYVGQFSMRRLDDEERRAFEYIVDLFAAIWTYNKIVRLTPDSEAYRERRGARDHSESIRLNSEDLIEGQLLLLVFLIISGAVINRGVPTLDGGRVHPPGFLRAILQMVSMMTLIESNQAKHFDAPQRERLGQSWTSAVELFVLSGLLPSSDLEVIRNPLHVVGANKVAEMIDEFDLRELQPMKPFYSGLKSL